VARQVHNSYYLEVYSEQETRVIIYNDGSALEIEAIYRYARGGKDIGLAANPFYIPIEIPRMQFYDDKRNSKTSASPVIT